MKKIGRRGAALALMFALFVAATLVGLFATSEAPAASGCCSSHKGVCGCACCDGTLLSKTCRAKTPGCSAENQETAAAPDTYQGKVTGVTDGDTIEVVANGAARRIRLADIDCPEKGQPFGAAAKKFTSSLAFGKAVEVRVRAKDRYGRIVADVVLPGSVSLNAKILEAGLAWWYHDYSKDESLRQIEKSAREARLGLWADPDPIPPWVFRRRDKK